MTDQMVIDYVQNRAVARKLVTHESNKHDRACWKTAYNSFIFVETQTLKKTLITRLPPTSIVLSLKESYWTHKICKFGMKFSLWRYKQKPKKIIVPVVSFQTESSHIFFKLTEENGGLSSW